MTAPNPPSSTSETIAAPSATPVPTGSQPWRAGPNSPFAGLTAEEIHGMALAQAQVLQKFNQPTPQPVPQPNRFDLDLPDDEFIQGRDAKRLMQQVREQSMAGDPIARQLAAQNVWGIIQI